MTDADALLESCSPEVRAIFVALDDLVREVMPDATAQLDIPDRLLAFGLGR